MATTTPNGGWPDASNTGLPPGVTLTASGDLVITKAGTVISGLNITGTVTIEAANVTLENCKITSGAYFVVNVTAGTTGAVVQNCEINGLGNTSGNVGINGQGTFIGNNIYNVENGINVTGATVIENNYIHDMHAAGSPHYDGIQIDGGVSNISIEHNTVINNNSSVSAIMIDNYWGPISNISVDNNLLVGGGFTVYDAQQFSGGTISGVSFTNNHMGAGQYGITDFTGTNPTYTGNVNDGAALAATLNTSANTGSGSSGGGTTTPPTTPTPNAPVITSGDHVTNDNTVTVSGTAAAGSTVTVLDGTTKLGTTTVGSNGSWSYTTAALSDGKHSLTATDTVSGKTSAASSAATLTIDTKAPVAPVLVSDSVVNTNQVLLNGTAEANSKITVYDGNTVVGTATAGSNGTWSVTTSALASGSQVLTATATDAAGNTSAKSAGLDPVIDPPTTPPAAGVPVITSGNHTTNDNTVTLTGTAVAGSTVTVFDGAAKLGTVTVNSSGAWNYTTAALNDGSHSLTATDTVSGKTSAASSAATIIVDTHAPTAPTLGIFTQAGATVGTTTTVDDFLLKGTAEANSTVKIFDAGKQVGTATANSSGAWSFDTGHEANGSHTFTSTATDAAGNTSAASAAKGVAISAGSTNSGTTIESSGSTSLVHSGHNYYLDGVGVGSGPELKYGGAAVTTGSVRRFYADRSRADRNWV